ELIKSDCDSEEIYHIHATGKFDYEDFMGWMKDAEIETENYSNLDIREYIDNMPVCLAAADIVICRSGAITLSEIQCAGKASILIPSPNVAENHQYYNALEMVERDAAFMLEEKNLTGEALIEKVEELCKSPQRLLEVGSNAKQMAIMDTAKRIADKLQEMV
ncbi:MAG: glycosyltransferase, partial [Oscillospiraceae bacterium]